MQNFCFRSFRFLRSSPKNECKMSVPERKIESKIEFRTHSNSPIFFSLLTSDGWYAWYVGFVHFLSKKMATSKECNQKSVNLRLLMPKKQLVCCLMITTVIYFQAVVVGISDLQPFWPLTSWPQSKSSSIIMFLQTDLQNIFLMKMKWKY